MTGVFITERRRRFKHRYTQGRPCNDGGRDQSDANPHQEMSRIANSHQKLRRGKGVFPRALISDVFPLEL